MNTKDLRKKNTAELKTLLNANRTALRNFRFAVAGSKIRNVKEGAALKLQNAQILTILNETK